MNKKTISLYDAFTFGFRMALENVRFFLKVFTTFGVVFFGALFVGLIPNIGLFNQLRSLAPQLGALKTCTGAACMTVLKPIMPVVLSAGWRFGLIGLFVFLVSCILFVGYTKIFLNLYDQKPVSVGMLFQYWRLVPKYFIASLIFLAIVCFGLMLFIIPGLIWALRFMFFNYFIIDKNAGIIESLRSSYNLTRGYTVELIALLGLVMFMGSLFKLSFIGGLILMPVGSFAFVHVYRNLLKK